MERKRAFTRMITASPTTAFQAKRALVRTKRRTGPRLSYAALYRGVSKQEHRFTDKAELLIQLNVGNGAGGGVAPLFAGGAVAASAGAGGVAANGFALWFSLQEYGFVNSGGTTTGQFLNYTEYSNLFDQYRIDEVVMDMMWCLNSAAQATAAAPTAPQELPIIYLATDHDDATPPATNTLFQYASCKNLQFGNSSGAPSGHQYYKLEPAVNMVSATAAGTAISAIKKHQWLNSDQPSVQQFGIKGWFDNPVQTGAVAAQCIGVVYCIFKIKFSCRCTK